MKVNLELFLVLFFNIRTLVSISSLFVESRTLVETVVLFDSSDLNFLNQQFAVLIKLNRNYRLRVNLKSTGLNNKFAALYLVGVSNPVMGVQLDEFGN
jgi:hypothetical protein